MCYQFPSTLHSTPSHSILSYWCIALSSWSIITKIMTLDLARHQNKNRGNLMHIMHHAHYALCTSSCTLCIISAPVQIPGMEIDVEKVVKHPQFRRNPVAEMDIAIIKPDQAYLPFLSWYWGGGEPSEWNDSCWVGKDYGLIWVVVARWSRSDYKTNWVQLKLGLGLSLEKYSTYELLTSINSLV